jgi:antitoxin component YwqK of YwqJK toxin-antitoxin module
MKQMTLTLLICLIFLSPNMVFGKTLTWDDLAYSGGLYYKKFSKVPFSGKITGKSQGKIKDGKKEGVWIEYDDNGQLLSKDNYKNGNKESPWDKFWSRIFNDGEKISD